MTVFWESEDDDFVSVDIDKPEPYIRELCDEHPWNFKDECTACLFITKEKCAKHPYCNADDCRMCQLEKTNLNINKSRFTVERITDEDYMVEKENGFWNYDSGSDDDIYGLTNLYGEENSFSSPNYNSYNNRCFAHPFYNKDTCPYCHPPVVKCVKGHIIGDIIDDECAYCYMLKHDNHRGKMLDWLECPIHKPYLSFSYQEKKDCSYCFLIRQPKCPKHPLIIKGNCEVCDGYKFVKKPYNKYDLCPKDKGRMKMNCKACSKGLIHCPVHPEEVKDACEICYFEECQEHKQRKENCSKCAVKRIIERITKNWDF